MTTSYTDIARLIKDKTGLQLNTPNDQEKLSQAVQARLQATHNTHPAPYLTLLQTNSHELQQLINLLTINETYFFREPEQITLLTEHLIPRLLAQRAPDDPIRILSAGCSSGEEPYSIAIALAEKYGTQAATLFQLYGGDIDSHILAKARKGQYSDFSFRSIPPDLHQRYFDTHQHTHQIKPDIRARVHFLELNLLQAKPSEHLHHFDIVFFRNVSIYFDTPTRRLIQQNLAKLMRPDGLLIIGTAETLANDLGVLPLQEEQGLFYFINRPVDPTAEQPPIASPHPTAPSNQPTAHTPLRPLTAQASSDKLTQLVAEKRYDAALPLADALLMQAPDDPAARLLKAFILLNRKHWLGAEELAKVVLEQDHWNLDAMLILGLSAKWQGKTALAQEWMKKAVYAHSHSWLAHYHLADLSRHQDQVTALRNYRATLQLLDKPSGLNILPQDLPLSEVRFLCEHQVRKLSLVQPGQEAP